MSTRTTTDQINAALRWAADAARELTTYPDRILRQPLPKHGTERRGERWWLIGHLRVLGEAQAWEVVYDPEMDEGRLRANW